jgi:hypothetical protein
VKPVPHQGPVPHPAPHHAGAIGRAEVPRSPHNGPAATDILLFIEQRFGKRLGAADQADVLRALDLDGAAAADFILAYAEAFKVDIAGFEPAFHHRDAGRAGRFGWPIRVPMLFGVRFPIPVSTLALAARSGVWPLRYPILRPQPVRDWINWVIVLVALPIFVALILLVWRAV